MKKTLILKLALVALVAILASFELQGAVISETGLQVSVTGYESFPQIALIIALQLVAIFGSRYWGRTSSRVASLLVSVFSILAIAPMVNGIFDNGGLQLIRAKVEKATGIADWVSQLEIIGPLQTNLVCLWAIVVAMSLSVALNLASAIFRQKAPLNQPSDWLN